MSKGQTSSGSAELKKLLVEMNKTGNFTISVLTDRQGLPIAYATAAGYDPDRQSAVVALVEKTAGQVGRQIGMAQADEIILNDATGQRLVCRFFNVNGHELILAVTMPDREQSFRRATSRAIGEIRRIWKSYWE
jgi:predicted regulator of Ras-like GTPase activity (Roadblock/LC7/MglB family)